MCLLRLQQDISPTLILRYLKDQKLAEDNKCLVGRTLVSTAAKYSVALYDLVLSDIKACTIQDLDQNKYDEDNFLVKSSH